MPLPEEAPLVRRPSASALALQQLQQWIEDGTLQPGEVLKDTEIAKTLGVSRTPIREAFQRLEQLGLVVTTRNTRTEVAPARPQDAGLLYVPLSVLHELAVQLAMPNLTDADLDLMTEINDRLLVAARSGDAVAARQADEDFHSVLFERANNPFLQQVTDWLGVHSRRLEHALLRAGRADDGLLQRASGPHLGAAGRRRAAGQHAGEAEHPAHHRRGRGHRNRPIRPERGGRRRGGRSRAGRVAAHPTASCSSRRTTSSSTSTPRPGPAGIATRPSATVSGVVSKSVRIGFSNVSHSIRPP